MSLNSSPNTFIPIAGGYPANGQYTQRLGVIADRTFACSTNNTTNKQTMSRTRHTATQTITKLALVYPNWYINAGAETGSGGIATIKCSLELSDGTIVPVKFGGLDRGIAQDLTNITTDMTTVNITKGDFFYVRTYWVGAAAGIWYPFAGGAAAANTSDVFAFGVTTTDLTGGGTITSGGSPGLVYGPLAIIGQTSNKSVMIVGDSKAAGLQEVTDYSLRQGPQARTFNAQVATANFAHSGDRGQDFANAANTNLIAVSQYFTHVCIAFGINDLNGGGLTAAQLLTQIKTIVAKFPNNSIIVCTLEPNTTSTDTWATVANQTPVASNAQRVIFNNTLRANGIPGVDHIADIADVVESSRDSGKWIANGTASFYTGDGLHPTSATSFLVARSLVVEPSLL